MHVGEAYIPRILLAVAEGVIHGHSLLVEAIVAQGWDVDCIPGCSYCSSVSCAGDVIVAPLAKDVGRRCRVGKRS